MYFADSVADPSTLDDKAVMLILESDNDFGTGTDKFIRCQASAAPHISSRSGTKLQNEAEREECTMGEGM